MRTKQRIGTILLDPGAFVMEEKMLRRIRDLAQRHRAGQPHPSDGVEPASMNRSERRRFEDPAKTKEARRWRRERATE